MHLVRVDVPGEQRFDLLDGIGGGNVRQHMAQVRIRLNAVCLGGFDQAVSGRTGVRAS